MFGYRKPVMIEDMQEIVNEVWAHLRALARERAQVRRILLFESLLILFFATHLWVAESVERRLVQARALHQRRATLARNETETTPSLRTAASQTASLDEATESTDSAVLTHTLRTEIAALHAAQRVARVQAEPARPQAREPVALLLTSRGDQRSDATAGEANEETSQTTLRDGFPPGSPLKPYLPVFEAAARKYGHDPRLMPAIAFIESSGGIHCAHHNPFGRLRNGAGSGLIRFDSWEEAIWDEAVFIYRHWGSVRDPRRMKGYCPNPAWGSKVRSAMRRF